MSAVPFLTPYLRVEAEAARLHRLIERIAKEGLQQGESVPARIMSQVEAYRAGRLEFGRAA